jgi:hypothetical protein
MIIKKDEYGTIGPEEQAKLAARIREMGEENDIRRIGAQIFGKGKGKR